MKGSPLLRVFFTLLVLAALAWPLHGLTSHRDTAAASENAPAKSPKTKVHLALTSTTAPFAFEISHLGQSIWKGESQTNDAATDLELEIPAEGVDLVVDASWAEAKPTALKLELSAGEEAPIAHTLWGTQKASEVLTFSWR